MLVQLSSPKRCEFFKSKENFYTGILKFREDQLIRISRFRLPVCLRFLVTQRSKVCFPIFIETNNSKTSNRSPSSRSLVPSTKFLLYLDLVIIAPGRQVGHFLCSERGKHVLSETVSSVILRSVQIILKSENEQSIFYDY